MKRRTFLLAGAAALGACARSPVIRPNPFEGGSASGNIRIAVENRNFNQATLESLGPVQRRIGIVGGLARREFTLPWPTDGDLRIRIDLLAGGRFTTNRVALKGGDTAYLTIENPVQRSLLRR